jgi:curved DNA-binding protein CbpA
MIANRHITDILLDLHEKSRSGILRVERKNQKKQFVLIKGLLAYAESNLPEEHLAKIMVGQGLLPQSRLREVAALMKNGKTSEEAILEILDHIPASTGSEMEQGRRQQAVSILASLLPWPEYDIHFYAGDDLVRCRLFLDLSLPELLAESARHAVSDRVIRLPEHFLQQRCSAIKECEGKIALLPLTTTEVFLYSQVRKPVSATDLLSLLPPDTRKPEDALLCLSLLGLIRLEDAVSSTGAIPAELQAGLSLQRLEEMLSLIERSDLYEVLAVARDASQEEIQSSYHKLAKQYHPDRFQSDECSTELRATAQHVFTGINAAYLTLKDSTSRAAYEKKRASNDARTDYGKKDRTGDEKTAEALFHNGKALIAGGEFDKAVESLKGCVWLRPERADYQHYLGVALSEIPDRRKKAEEHLLKALELDFTSIKSRLALARLYANVMLRKKALFQLEEVLRWDPENREARKLLDILAKARKN